MLYIYVYIYVYIYMYIYICIYIVCMYTYGMYCKCIPIYITIQYATTPVFAGLPFCCHELSAAQTLGP